MTYVYDAQSNRLAAHTTRAAEALPANLPALHTLVAGLVPELYVERCSDHLRVEGLRHTGDDEDALTVYWDDTDPQNEGWAYRRALSLAEGDEGDRFVAEESEGLDDLHDLASVLAAMLDTAAALATQGPGDDPVGYLRARAK